MSGTRAYVTSTSNTAELEIVNVTNPAAPSLLGTYNAAGNADATDVWVNGTTAYLTRTTSADPEFLVLNVTNPASVSVVGSLNLNGSPAQLAVLVSYAYLASSDDAQELQVVNITTPASPALSGSYNASGTSNSLSVAAFGTTVLLGRTTTDMVILWSPHQLLHPLLALS